MTSEDEGLRLKWTAFLEFTQNQDVGEMTWDKVNANQISCGLFNSNYQTIIFVGYINLKCIHNEISTHMLQFFFHPCTCYFLTVNFY